MKDPTLAEQVGFLQCSALYRVEKIGKMRSSWAEEAPEATSHAVNFCAKEADYPNEGCMLAAS